MVLKLSSAGVLSLVLLPAVFLLVLRVLGFSSDPLGLILKLILSEAIALSCALFLVIYLKLKNRITLPQT